MELRERQTTARDAKVTKYFVNDTNVTAKTVGGPPLDCWTLLMAFHQDSRNLGISTTLLAVKLKQLTKG